VVDVQVWTDEPRPVWITVSDHAHTYEVAWRDTDDGPVITDLRVHSEDGAPITSDTLRRINTDTLARTARRYATARAAENGRKLREAVEIATAQAANDPAEMVAGAIAWCEEQGLEDAARELRRVAAEVGPAALVASGFGGVEAFRWTEGVIDAMVRTAPRGIRLAVPNRRRGGRPKTITEDFLALVAEWAREGRDRNERPLYPFIAERAAAHLGHPVQNDTVKGWVRRAKDAGLLAPDELRKPR
jgi:transposase